MKCFERLGHSAHQVCLPPSLDPFQFAYRSNRSTDDAIATALHPALTHLDKTDTYVRLLFIDFSSAFNTIILNSSSINWSSWGSIRRCATGCWTFWPGDPQAVRVGSTHPAPAHWTQGPPKDVCWAPSSSLCWPTTAHRHTTPTASLICRWHDCGGSHQQQRWDKLQERGEPPGRVVQWQQSLSECGEDEGDCRWLQESAHLSMLLWPSMVRPWREWAAPSSWVYTSRGPLWTNNTAALAKKAQQRLLLPPQTKKSQSPGPHHVHLLQRHHREHSD